MTRRSAPLDLDLDRRRRIQPVRPPREPAYAFEVPSWQDRGVLLVTGIAWWGLLLLAMALVPEVDGAGAEQLTAIDQLVGLVQLSVLAAVTLLLLSGNRRGAGGAMLVGGAVFLASSVGCVASGHHSFGAWWYGHAAALSGMLVAGAAALRGALRR